LDGISRRAHSIYLGKARAVLQNTGNCIGGRGIRKAHVQAVRQRVRASESSYDRRAAFAIRLLEFRIRLFFCEECHALYERKRLDTPAYLLYIGARDFWAQEYRNLKPAGLSIGELVEAIEGEQGAP